MVCSALWLIHQISMNSIKATYSTFARLLRLQAMQISFIVFIPRLTENLTQAELLSGWSVQHCGLSIKSPWTQLKQLTAPSQDFCGYKRCRYHSLFSFRDWLRIWRRLNCSPLKSLTCSCIDFSLYNRPWRRGFGKSVWGTENALFVNLRFVLINV